MTSRVLAHDVISGERPEAGKLAFLLHGILGSKKNWGSIARRLAQRLPTWRFVTADLRCHGESQGFAPPHTVAACAEDVAALAAHLGEEPAWLSGHSFGGKVALSYARDFAAELRTLWVLDSPPGTSRPGGGTSEVERVMRTLREVALPIAGRQELVDELAARGLSEDLGRWMTTNLAPRDRGGFEWTFDLDGAEALLKSYAALDLWEVLERPPTGVDVHFVRGARSNRFSPDDEHRLERLGAGQGASVHVLADAGHWVHSDNPKGLLELFFTTLTP